MRSARPAVSFLLVTSIVAAGGLSVAAVSASAADTAAPSAQANAKGGMPALSDSADVAFQKLDAGAKGYVTLEDVAGLPGFATAFTNADSSHLGRLNPTAFKSAWAVYVKSRS